MQFAAIFATAFALVASASAQTGYQTTPSYPIGNSTAPQGTAVASGTGAASTGAATYVPDANAASTLSTGAMGLLVVGGIALAL